MARKEKEKASEDALGGDGEARKKFDEPEYLFRRKHTTWRKRFLGFLFFNFQFEPVHSPLEDLESSLKIARRALENAEEMLKKRPYFL